MLLVQNKVTKQKTPLPLISCTASKSRALRNSPNKTLGSDSPRLNTPNFLNHHRRGNRGFMVKNKIKKKTQTQTSFLRKSLARERERDWGGGNGQNFNQFFLRVGEILSFTCSKQNNQRNTRKGRSQSR